MGEVAPSHENVLAPMLLGKYTSSAASNLNFWIAKAIWHWTKGWG